ncbi:AAA family ATPase [Rhodobacteraceae bacterium KMM 6894]|nr:AAA family ATPase [Rhodobacteraceae bacterium KMM 6894]
MTNKSPRNPTLKECFASKLSCTMAQSLFDHEWDGMVDIRPAITEPDDDEFIANMPDDMLQSVAKRSWEAPEACLADTMTEAEIGAALRSNRDPWAQSSVRGGRALLKGDPPPSLIAAAFALGKLVDSEDHLQDLFRPGHVTHFVCPAGSFIKALDEILPKMIRHWKNQLSPAGTADLHSYVQDDDGGKHLKSRHRTRDFVDAPTGRSLAQSASVLLVTTGQSQLSEAMTALVRRKMAWPGLTSDIIIETLRLTHSATGKVAETDIRARLPDNEVLKVFGPAQVDAAFAAPTTLEVADQLSEIASKLKRSAPVLTLDALHGITGVRASLDRMLNDLMLWQDNILPWSEVASSAVFHGPPGTGKTTLAKAFAGSAGIPIIATSYSDCQKHGHQGDMLAALDKAFAEAAAAAPAVLFIDELDSFSHRDEQNANTGYMRGVVNGLLEQINRAKDIGGLILFGATNHLATIDPAVIRSGRFDLKLHVPYPDKGGLEAILAAKLGLENAGMLHLAPIAGQLLGQSGAVAEAVVRDALGRARVDRVSVQQKHLQSAADQITPRLDDETERRAAIHEAGHVLVMMRLGWPLPTRVCLTSAGGQVEHVPFRMLTPKTARERLLVLLAGRAAEICMFGHPSSGAGTGARSDLAQATSLALAIERQWGFGESGLVWDAATAEEIWRVPEDVRCRVERHLLNAEKQALSIVSTNREHVINLGDQLLRARELNGQDIEDSVPLESLAGTPQRHLA